jgi:hypothetical protein
MRRGRDLARLELLRPPDLAAIGDGVVLQPAELELRPLLDGDAISTMPRSCIGSGPPLA